MLQAPHSGLTPHPLRWQQVSDKVSALRNFSPVSQALLLELKRKPFHGLGVMGALLQASPAPPHRSRAPLSNTLFLFPK